MLFRSPYPLFLAATSLNEHCLPAPQVGKSPCHPSPLPKVFTVSAGGGSALLPAPIPPVTLEEKQTLTKLLAARGATIQELNTIRKALSQLKGGGLAQAAYPAQVCGALLHQAVWGWWNQAHMCQGDEGQRPVWESTGLGVLHTHLRGVRSGRGSALGGVKTCG